MTSTSFNVGMSSESKNSSRVLKPPGGGHTDIFGSCDPEPIKHYRHPASTIVIGDGKNHNSTTQSTTEQITTQSTVVTEQTSSHVEESSNHVETSTKVTKEAAGYHNDGANPETPYGRRARVPPGGFSSGLW